MKTKTTLHIQLTAGDVSSACREFIVKERPELSKGFTLSPSSAPGEIEFLAESDAIQPSDSGLSLKLVNGNLSYEYEGKGCPVEVPVFAAGRDYLFFYDDGHFYGTVSPWKNEGKPIGGFHVGLDGKIVPASVWDQSHRPVCDPSGMVFLSKELGWMDIYLAGEDGTSKAGQKPVNNINWHDSVKLLAKHGKTLPTRKQFEFAAEGVMEGKAADDLPKLTEHIDGLKSSIGLEQATGTLWVWTSESTGDRKILAGGSCCGSGGAGPRCMSFGHPVNRYDLFGVRGRCDHLSPVSLA